MSTSRKKNCGSTDTSDGTPCSRIIPRDAEACFMHKDDGTPDGHGAPEGNDNALDNDGGAPEGNMNAVEHGAYMSFNRRVEFIQQRGLEDIFRSHLREARQNYETEHKAVRVATTATVEEGLLADLMDSGGDDFFDTNTLNAWIEVKRQLRLLISR